MRETDAIIVKLRESAEQIFLNWPLPEKYEQLNLSDAVFAYRLLLGRNPNLDQELPHLRWLSESKTLKEFLQSLIASSEFQYRTDLLPPNHILMAELDDFRFWFDTSDTEMGVKMAMGQYETETVQFFRHVIKPGMTCWDIGAQTGFMTCLFARLVGAAGRVFAYEPLPRSFEMIKRNVYENKLDSNVVIRNVACSDSKGNIPMITASEMLVVDKTSVDATLIECVRLDEENLPLPDLIKIDVEGHEPAVLSGLAKVLKKSRPIIVLELNEYWLSRNSGTSGREVIKNLNQLGFVVSSLDNPGTKIDWADFKQGILGNCNVIARRSE